MVEEQLNMRLKWNRAILPKPFTPDGLTCKVREVLDG